MEFPLPDRSSVAAVIFPGILFGTLIWAVVMGSDHFLTLTGHESMRSTLFLLNMLTTVPLLLIVTGAAAEKIQRRDHPAGWRPTIPYLAGFLGMCSAGFLFALESGMTQYVPDFPPGLDARLVFALGRVIMYMPEVAVLSVFFALFALAGGYGAHRILERSRVREKYQKE